MIGLIFRQLRLFLFCKNYVGNKVLFIEYIFLILSISN